MTFLMLFAHPLRLIALTLAPDGSDGVLRWQVWTADMAVLSLFLPLVIGVGARVVAFRADGDAAPRKDRNDIASDGIKYTYRFQRAEEFRAAPRHELELPSPEPEPFTYPPRG